MRLHTNLINRFGFCRSNDARDLAICQEFVNEVAAAQGIPLIEYDDKFKLSVSTIKPREKGWVPVEIKYKQNMTDFYPYAYVNGNETNRDLVVIDEEIRALKELGWTEGENFKIWVKITR